MLVDRAMPVMLPNTNKLDHGRINYHFLKRFPHALENNKGRDVGFERGRRYQVKLLRENRWISGVEPNVFPSPRRID